MQVTLIPTHCPRFVAACAVCGIELAEGTPGISNTYSKLKKYDPREPGDIHFYLSDGQGVNPLAIAKVWAAPDAELADAATIKSRLVACKSLDEWAKIADDIEILHLTGAVATIRHFEQGKFPIGSKSVSDGEERAAQIMSDFAGLMRSAKSRNGAKFAAAFDANWTPSMFAWVKAWVAQYLELKDSWKIASKAIKIDRDDRFPLIIPHGKNFHKLLKKWT